MDGWSLHFTVHPWIYLSAKIHLDVMIEEGAAEELEAKSFGAGNEAARGQKHSTSD